MRSCLLRSSRCNSSCDALLSDTTSHTGCGGESRLHYSRESPGKALESTENRALKGVKVSFFMLCLFCFSKRVPIGKYIYIYIYISESGPSSQIYSQTSQINPFIQKVYHFCFVSFIFLPCLQHVVSLSVLTDYRKGGARKMENDMQQRSLQSHVNERPSV